MYIYVYVKIISLSIEAIFLLKLTLEAKNG